MPQAKLYIPLCLAILTLTTSAEAQSNRQMMRDLDSNGDRLIQFSELQALRAQAFDRIDFDGNGIADPSEVSVLEQLAGQYRRIDAFSFDRFAVDRDGDGVITRVEFATFIPERTLLADRNGDGALSRTELRALR